MKKRKTREHKKLPSLTILESKYDYDPLTGGIFKKGDPHIDYFCVGHFDKKGYRKIAVEKQLYFVHRIVYYMYHRKDPGAAMIDHKNGDPADNRIENLRLVKTRSENMRNIPQTRKYVVDEEGCGKWVNTV